MSALTAALLKETGRHSRDELTDQERFYFDYANTSNERGEQLIAKMEQDFIGSLAGRQVLDIGSGYGGCCIAAAKRGAAATGLELSARTRDMAVLNLGDFPGLDVRFSDLDMTTGDPLAALGQFDLIIADNVIEHVRSPAGLLANASRLLKPGGYLYVTAPNARSVDMVKSECHYGMAAASLVSPKMAERLLGAPYDVSHYLDFIQYQGLFGRYGLQVWHLLPESATPQEIQRLYAQGLDVAAACIGNVPPGDLGIFVREAVERWRDEFTADIEFMLRADPESASNIAGRLQRDYGYGLWYFVARKP